MKYDNDICNQFVEDMEDAGIEVEHYNGRFFWEGPSVRTDERNGPTLHEVYRATKIEMQKDNCAFDWIMYPVRSGKLIEE